MEPLAAVSFPATVAAIAAPVTALLMGLFGYRHGLFLATVIGLVLLSGVVGALALAPAGAAFLESFDCPARHSLAVAYGSLVAVAAAVCRFGVGELLPDDDVRLAGLPDKVGGLLVGGVTGVLVAGAVLVGWSMMHLPQGLKPDATAMKADAAARVLQAFARSLHADPAARERLLRGDLVRDGDPSATGEKVLVSEPFDDVDGDWKRSAEERFLDLDRDGEFTLSAPAIERSAGGSARRPVGLLDAYWLGSWRTIRVLTAPRLTSPGRVKADTRVAERPVLQLAATDPDDGDAITFGLRPQAGDDARLVRIDPQTGEVFFDSEVAGSDRQKIRFTAVVTDRSGLTDQREITVSLPDEATRPEDPPAAG